MTRKYKVPWAKNGVKKFSFRKYHLQQKLKETDLGEMSQESKCHGNPKFR